METFKQLDQNELEDLNGGMIDPITGLEIIAGIATVIGTAFALYETAKADAAEAGKRDAYKDIKATSGIV